LAHTDTGKGKGIHYVTGVVCFSLTTPLKLRWEGLSNTLSLHLKEKKYEPEIGLVKTYAT